MRERVEGIVEVFSPKDKPSRIIECPEKRSAQQFVLDITKTCDELGYRPADTWKTYLESFKKDMEAQPFAKLWGREEDYI